jgi:hypothetical protein
MGANLSTVTYYPGYNQVQIQFIPIKQQIASITQAFPMVVTTSQPHGYRAGQNVAFIIPLIFGMQQLNHITADIISVTSNTFTTDIDSRNFFAFAYPSMLPSAYSLPYVIPNAEGVDVAPPLPYGNQRPFFGTVQNGEMPLTGGG